MTTEPVSFDMKKLKAYIDASEVDIHANLGYIVLSTAIALAAPEMSLARFVVGVPLLIFVPGYALVTALFPGKWVHPPDVLGDQFSGRGELTAIERVMLAVCGSLVVVPTVAAIPYLLGVGDSLPLILTLLVTTSVAGFAVGLYRRRRLPDGQQFNPAVGEWMQRRTEWLSDRDEGLDTYLGYAILLSIVVLSATAGFALLSTPSGTQSTELMLLTENSDGSYVAGGFPDSFTAGDSAQFVMGVQNNEQQPVEYTVVVMAQRVSSGDGSVTVQQSQELHRFTRRVSPGETWYKEHSVSPQLTGERVRITYLLYKGDAPADPSVETAYRTAYITTSVSDT